MQPQADAHGAALRIDQRSGFRPGRRARRILALKHLTVAIQQRSLAFLCLVLEFHAQADVHRAGTQPVRDLVRVDAAVDADAARQGQIHRAVCDRIIILFRGRDAEIEMERPGRRLIDRFDVRLLPVFQTAHRGRDRLRPATPDGLPGLAAERLSKRQVGHAAQEHAAR